MKIDAIRKLELNPTGGAPANGGEILANRPLFRVVRTINLTGTRIEQIISLTASETRPQINMSQPQEFRSIDAHGHMHHRDGSTH